MSRRRGGEVAPGPTRDPPRWRACRSRRPSDFPANPLATGGPRPSGLRGLYGRSTWSPTRLLTSACLIGCDRFRRQVVVICPGRTRSPRDVTVQGAALREGEGVPQLSSGSSATCALWMAGGGFARFRCGACRLDRLVPFSCKGRRFVRAVTRFDLHAGRRGPRPVSATARTHLPLSSSAADRAASPAADAAAARPGGWRQTRQSEYHHQKLNRFSQLPSSAAEAANLPLGSGWIWTTRPREGG